MPATGKQYNIPSRVFTILLTAVTCLYLFWGKLSPSMAHETNPMASRKLVSILSVSQNRTVVRTIHDYIQPHGYAIGGILEADPFSAPALALSLKVLEPRPQVVLVGKGYSEEQTEETRKVFEHYVSDVGVSKGIVIKITSKVFDDVGKEGVPKWVLGQLEEYFGSGE